MPSVPGYAPDWTERVVAAALIATTAVACGRTRANEKPIGAVTLRIGISSGQLSATNPASGIRQIVQIVTTESLARVGPNGRMEPQLADSWSVENDGRSLRVDLKTGLRFSDGTPLDAKTLATTLSKGLESSLEPVIGEAPTIQVRGDHAIEISVKRPTPLLLESLEEPVRKPSAPTISTGPFLSSADSPNHLYATDTYYRGRPAIDDITIRAFPSVRSAWAELLRNKIDMLYEVGTDALDSLESSTNVAVFTFTRPYQYMISFNEQAPVLQSKTVRQALNLAVDRAEVVRRALGGHGEPATGPLRPDHWAAGSLAGFAYDPLRAAEMLRGHALRFTCLIPSDPLYERLALDVKRQFAAVDVDMELKSLPPDDLLAATRQRHYEAALSETITGPTLLRLYLVWDRSSVQNVAGRGSGAVDAALRTARAAATESEYRQAFFDVQQAFIADPPAVFLAWSERARAVTRRFSIPQPERGRDILGTLRLWKPSNDDRIASRN